MINIDKHISELLYRHDCVIIPGLGGFVANYATASIHPVQHTFTPPSKNIAFNKNLQNNDGLLSNYISIAENTTFKEANAIISTFADRCNRLLKSGERVEIKKVGIIYSDVEQNIQFEPGTEVNYLLHSFGLTDFQSPAIRRDNLQKKIEKQFKDRPAIPFEIKKKNIKQYWTVLAALPLSLLMLVAPINSNLLNGISIDYSNLNPFSNKDKAAYQVRTPASFAEVPNASAINLFDVPDTLNTIQINLLEEYDPEYSGNPGIWVNLEEIATAPENTKGFEAKKTVNRFYIIGGCFEHPENAKSLMSELKVKGFTPSIVDHNRGLTRVSYKSFSSKDEAIHALAKIKSDHNPNAWLLIK